MRYSTTCMAEQEMLYPDNELDIMICFTLFLPQINHSIMCFSGAWN